MAGFSFVSRMTDQVKEVLLVALKRLTREYFNLILLLLLLLVQKSYFFLSYTPAQRILTATMMKLDDNIKRKRYK